MPDTTFRFARQRGLDFLEQQAAGRGNQLSDEEAMALALEAQRAARAARRKSNKKANPKR